MAEDEPTFDSIVAERAYKIDKQLRNVMPDSWIGHARIALAGRNLSDSQKEQVLEHTRNILDKNPDYPADMVAEKVMEKIN
jgi:Golgi nucleoside diphosphatase